MNAGSQRGTRRHLEIILVTLGLFFLSDCAPRPKVQYPSVQLTMEFEDQAAAADAFFKKGCYVDFKKAIAIYRELYTQLSMKDKIRVPFVKVLILMTVRERDLGILNDSYIQMASDVIQGYPTLQFSVPYIELVKWMYPKTRGIMQDIDTMGTWQIVNKFLKNKRLNAEMQLRARSDDYFAYLYVTFYLEYARYLGEKGELADFSKQYPDSILFKYKKATTFPWENKEQLEALLKAEPEFYEAYYYLGELALGVNKPLDTGQDILSPFKAERYFLKAYKGIPESPQITIYLGGIYLSTGEYEKGIKYFDKTLALAPTYRDATLGKSICLSYMGKHDEAIDILNHMVTLGFYLMGESHYWLAWNYNELKKFDEAQHNIEESETRLPNDSEVFSLAGTIALEKNEIDKAKKEFETSLECNGRNIKSVLGLGRVFALKQRWLVSAQLYSHAVIVVAQEESELTDQIQAIENSALAQERKIRIVGLKKHQIEILEESRAMACYEAAVGYIHAGQKERALELAMKAAAYPQYKEAAEQLIRHIK